MTDRGSTEAPELLRLKTRLDRERRIRIEAEAIAERALRDLYDKQQALSQEAALRRNLEHQLGHAQKMEAIGRLAGGVAHDFNNLLTVIIGMAAMITDDLPAGDPLRPAIAEIHKAGERAALLTRQLLAFGRKQFLTPIVLNLNSVVAGLRQMLKYLAGNDIELSFALDPVLRPVTLDPSQVEQVVINLVMNAKDAMPTGGKLLIETMNVDLDATYTRTHPEVPPGLYAALVLSDTGCGMDDETKSRVFEPFFTTKELGRGSGLGLATVHGIVRQSGGHIWVYSEPDRGTTFKLYFPQAAQSQLVPRAHQPVEAPVRGGTETILVLEDEPGVLALTSGILEQHGYTVIRARDCRDALRQSDEHAAPIHMILADVIVPDGRGPEVAATLLGRRPSLKVLFMSGYTDDALGQHHEFDSRMAFLQKPFTGDLLLRKVREVLDGV